MQIICTVLQYDGINDPDIVALVAASAVLSIAGLPFNGPIAAARVGLENGKFILNPEFGYKETSDLDLVVAGTKTSVMMVESEANILTEEQMLEAVEFAHKNMQPVIKLIEDITAKVGKEKWVIEKPDHSKLQKEVKKLAEKDLRKAYKIQDKQARSEELSAIKDKVHEKIEEKFGEEYSASNTDSLIKKLEKEIVRGDLVAGKKRIDGRNVDEVRNIEAEVQFLSKTHGSSLFTRGETQALSVVTLGNAMDAQRIDSLEGDITEHFMLHYNFPPFSVGEVSMLRGPGRREIGHGKLAWRALNKLIPSNAEFPYTIRAVTEVTESNGSSSMATVCGTSLALMDAGVPMKDMCAGIAMGLILEGEEYVVLTDILGDEDHLGDMDFKVAGTKDGITSLQMDIKVQGISTEIMQKALAQAKDAREHILGKMTQVIKAPRKDLSSTAPRFISIQIPANKIREVIGSGGKVIKDICEKSGAKIDIEDSGKVNIMAANEEQTKIATSMIEEIVVEAEIGKVYKDGKIVKIIDFGVIVEFLGKTQGLVHVSQINNERVEHPSDVLSENDKVHVKVISIDRQGKIKLSMKDVNQETGELIVTEKDGKEAS